MIDRFLVVSIGQRTPFQDERLNIYQTIKSVAKLSFIFNDLLAWLHALQP